MNLWPPTHSTLSVGMRSSTLRVPQRWDLETLNQVERQDAERPKRYSHAERGNEGKSSFAPRRTPAFAERKTTFRGE
jgi:hypothetical protein